MKLLVKLFCAAALICAGGAPALADPWPSKPVRLIVPFPTGGASDIAGRILGDRLTSVVGQSVYVENKVGVAGVFGSEFAAKAPADGYTLLLTSLAPFAFAPSTEKKVGYDPLNDFNHVAMIGSVPLVLYVNNDSPIRSVADLVRLAKEKPGALNFGNGGVASPSHLYLERFKARFDLDILGIPFKGTANSLMETMAGRLDGSFDSLPGILASIKGGKVRAIAVTSDARHPALPDVPSITEVGYPELEATSWFGIAVPAGTSKDIVARLNKDINAQLQLPEVRSKYSELAFAARTMSPEELKKFVGAEIAKWKSVVVATKIAFQ